MESEVQSRDLVGSLLDVSVSPERLRELIALWDARVLRSGQDRVVWLTGAAGSEFAREVAGAVRLLESLRAAERQQLNETLSSLCGASMVLAEDGEVIAANDAARLAFGLKAGGTIRSMPLDSATCAEFAQRIAEVSGAGALREDVVRLRPEGPDRVVQVHLRALQSGRARPLVLAVTTEQAWSVEVSRLLVRVFDLAPAEIEVLRLLTGGATVASIAGVAGRSRGTIRAQIHAILQKTETRNQAEAVRLAMMLMDSMRVATQPRPTLPAPEPHRRFLLMPDGRRVEVMSFGARGGRPILWMQSFYGFVRLPRSAERELARRGLEVVLPLRAGYGGGDPAPSGRNAFEVAVADIGAIMTELRIAAAPVVAPDDSIRIALMLAQAEPSRVRHVFGLGSFFPIRNDDHYRRLHPPARFFRACARYQPKVLTFLTRAVRRTVFGQGADRYLRGVYAGSAADARAFAEPEILDAVVAGLTCMFSAGGSSDEAFSTELVLVHRDWPDALGRTACPVTLIHGEQDGNCPCETAREYCALYPAWRYIGYPDEGQLLALSRWRDIFDLIESSGSVASRAGFRIDATWT